MFEKSIQITPFSSTMADAIMENITYSTADKEVSFISTLRALLYPRLKDGETLNYKYIFNDLPATSISNNLDNESLFKYWANGNLMPNTFYVVNSRRTAKVDNVFLDAYKNHFCECFSDWRPVNKFHEFYKKSFETYCFVNEEMKSVVIVYTGSELSKLHYLQCGIVAALPWYFSTKDGVNENEMNLIRSLMERSADKYLQCLEEIMNSFNLRPIWLEKSLGGIEKYRLKAEQDSLDTQIKELDDVLLQYNLRIADILDKKDDLVSKRTGVELQIRNTSSENDLLEYFKCNKHLNLIHVYQNVIEFSVEDDVTYFDEELAQKLLDNETSYLYHNAESYDDVYTLISAIFITQQVKLRFCAKFQIKLSREVYPLSFEDREASILKCMPNPHIHLYHCLGNYVKLINQCLQNNDNIGAIENCVASCKSLNFGDSVVISAFVEELMNTDKPCIELPDKTMVTPQRALDYIEEGIL